MQTHSFHDNGCYIVFAYSSRKKDCEILLFHALLHESFQYYLSRRQGKGLSLSGYLLKVRAQEVTNNIFLSLRFHDIAKYILEFLLRNLIIVSANSNRSSLASKYDILMTVVPTIA